jgi:hypothetical protein
VAHDIVQLWPRDSLVRYPTGITEAGLPAEVDQLDESGFVAVLVGQASGASGEDVAGVVVVRINHG